MKNGKKPKHVIWILADQLRADCVGFMNNSVVKTPNLDKLACDGVVFDNMFVQYPACMASRASMLTGRYPSTIRMSNGSPLLDPREITLFFDCDSFYFYYHWLIGIGIGSFCA